MINKAISFPLPTPWKDKRFEASTIGHINFLVGPNGSGKSRFLNSLQTAFPGARLLGTDRLSGMEQGSALKNIFGDNLSGGLAKGHFEHFKNAGKQGSGIDTIILLEEKLELRIQVEATLSHLFNRKIYLEWDSGNLLAKAILNSNGTSYRLDKEECHGIKELLVMLTHLYNEDNKCIIIDEPELNLHPQYQSYFMQEVRKLAGDPEREAGKKVVFLATHSPFILDFKHIDDIKSVTSFSIDHSVPRQMSPLDAHKTGRLSSLVPRININHKQLFFSDNPIFVEGNFDAQLISSIQEARGVSISGAGSCIIEAGGCEEVNLYLDLCIAFDKKAHFVFDLDSLFSGNLRSCVKNDGTVQEFLLVMGFGNDFAKYCGELDRILTQTVDGLLAKQGDGNVGVLFAYLASLGARASWDGKLFAKARVAVVTAISRHRADMISAITEMAVKDIENRVKQIAQVLSAKNIHLLVGGTLERYLPCYSGNPYAIDDQSKKRAVIEEIQGISSITTDQAFASRYGELFEVIKRLPSKLQVDADGVLRRYISQYIHDIQVAISGNSTWDIEKVRGHLVAIEGSTSKVFTLTSLNKTGDKRFTAEISILPMLGKGQRKVRISNATNAGMGDYEITSE